MVLRKEKVEEIVALVKKEYPDWSGFSHPKFVKDEIEYKQSAVAKACELLSESELRRLQSEEKFEEIISRIKKTANATNLLWNWAPATGDLSILEQPKLDKPTFCKAFIDLLYSPEPSQERLGRYLNFVNAHALPNKWTFSTYFLFLCHPETEMFVKPRAIKRFLEFLEVDEEVRFKGTPSSEVYLAIKQIALQIKENLKDYEPRDLVDIQSVIYLIYTLINNNVMKKEKRAEFLKLFIEFADKYLSSPGGKEHKTLYANARAQARRNLDEILEAQKRGENITDRVILKLLPYANSDQARKGDFFHSPAWVFRTDARKKLEGVGFVKPEDWPLVAEAILKFVRRCDESPRQLYEACAEFSSSPYSKGFQTGTLTPILNALNPDQFVLINNKSRKVLKYFAEKSYSQSLSDYPKANETALSLLKGVSDDIKDLSKTDLPATDLFDLFSYWYIAIRQPGLPEPFSRIFTDHEEAEWAFGLLKKTLYSLGVKDPEDERFAITLPKDGNSLRLIFGQWLILDFKSIELTENRVTLTFLKDLVNIDDSFITFNFAKKAEEPDVKNYSLPIEMVRPLDGDLRIAFEKTLDFIKNKFGAWKRTIWRNHYHAAEIGKAIFDEEKLEKLLSGNITFRSPSYWVFQCNPNQYDLRGALNELKELTWRVTSYKTQIHTDDIVYLWESGNDAGIVAIGKVLTDPGDFPESEDEKKFYVTEDRETKSKQSKVRVSIEQVLKNKIKRQDLLSHPVLKSLLILKQPHSTNFAVTEEESLALEELAYPSPMPVYTLDMLAADIYKDTTNIESWLQSIHRKGQAIIYGPPGTGKTFVAEHIARHLVSGGDGFVDLVQFHPAYAYEDFIQGIRPVSEDGNLKYCLVKGKFREFCQRAEGKGICVLIIDEINRANLARVFGELMYLLEYRDKEIPLASGESLCIPDNVRIIGTMNTADRSIALVDHALRRRFAFIKLKPDYEVLKRYHQRENTGFPVDRLVLVLQDLNRSINDSHYELGISYFLKPDLKDHLEDIWKMEIEPYLDEYFFDNRKSADKFRWESIRSALGL